MRAQQRAVMVQAVIAFFAWEQLIAFSPCLFKVISPYVIGLKPSF